MIKVIYRDNINASEKIVSENTTVKSFLEEEGIDYSSRPLAIDGAMLSAGEVNKTFADFGVTEKCYLTSVAKLDNAGDEDIDG